MRGPITACLLHADFHVMDHRCWTETLLWMGAHEDLSDDEQRAAYQATVERVILDRLRPREAAPDRASTAT